MDVTCNGRATCKIVSLNAHSVWYTNAIPHGDFEDESSTLTDQKICTLRIVLYPTVCGIAPAVPFIMITGRIAHLECHWPLSTMRVLRAVVKARIHLLRRLYDLTCPHRRFRKLNMKTVITARFHYIALKFNARRTKSSQWCAITTKTPP